MFPLSPLFTSLAQLFVLDIEAFAEALHAPGSVKNTLLPGEERVALRADIHLQDWLDTQRLKAISTGATYCGFDVIWMYSLFHGISQVW